MLFVGNCIQREIVNKEFLYRIYNGRRKIMKENRLLKWKKIVTCLTTASFLLFNIIEPNSVKAKIGRAHV